MLSEQLLGQVRSLTPADKLALYELLSGDPDITEDDVELIRIYDERRANPGQLIPHDEVKRRFGL